MAGKENSGTQSLPVRQLGSRQVMTTGAEPLYNLL